MSIESRKVSANRLVQSFKLELSEGGSPTMPSSGYDSMKSLALSLEPPDTTLATACDAAKAADDSYSTGVAVDLMPFLDACETAFGPPPQNGD